MSLFFNSDDVAHLERVHRAQMRHNHGIFLDVKPVNEPPPAYPTEKFNAYDSYLGYKEKESIDESKINKDMVYECSKPVYIVMRAMGAFPITKTEPGVFRFTWCSAAMMYAVLAFAAFMTYIAFVAINRIQIVSSLEGRFEESVVAYLFIVNIFPIVLIPLMWYESKKVAVVMNNWTDFEIMYYKTTSKPLVLNLKSKALLISILLPLLSCISVIITHITMIHFKLERAFVFQIIPYCFLDTLTYIFGAYWYLACEQLSRTALLLADDFQKALRHIGPAALVSEYRALWLRLSKLARDTGFATCYVFTFINLYLFFIVTLSIYGLMSQLSEGFGIKDIGLALTAICSTCLLFFICNEAHYASIHIRTNFQKKLLMVELSWMNSDAQTEINMFLRATEMNPSNINLGGFFDVNRTLFKSLLTTMVTYLVVLLQFQISLPDDPSVVMESQNGTSDANSTSNYNNSSTTMMTTIADYIMGSTAIPTMS